MPTWCDTCTPSAPPCASGHDRASTGDGQSEPVGEVLELGIDGRPQAGRERGVLMDRGDPQQPGRKVSRGVDLSDQPVLVQDRQRPVAPAALVRWLVHLELVLELE